MSVGRRAETAPSNRAYEWVSTLIVLGVGVAATFALVWHLRGFEEQRLHAAFRADAARLDAAIVDRFASAEAALEDLGSLLSLDTDLSREEFRRFVTPLLARYDFLRALSWNPRVPSQERAAFERREQLSGVPAYRITEKEERDGDRAPARSQHVVVRFIEPLAGNEAALGFDIASEPTRREAIERARTTGEVAVTAPIALVQEANRLDGALALLPLYHPEAPSGDDSFRGVVVAVLLIGRLVEDAVVFHDTAGIDIDLAQGGNAGAAGVHAHSGVPHSAAPPADLARLAASTGFSWGGREWRLTFTPTREYLAANSRDSVPAATAAGIACTLLVAMPVALLANRTRRLRWEVDQRRLAEAELRRNEERLMLVVSSAGEGIWDWNVPTGEVYFSPSWKSSLGYEDEQVPGRIEFWESIVHPEDMPRVQAALGEHLAGDTKHYECENRLLRGDGTWRWNLDVGRVVERDADGRPLRMVGVDRDISERQAAREIQARTERQFQEAQRLESLGVLAGGIAHDFNNLLTVILGNAAMLGDLQKGEAQQEAYAEIEQAGGLASELCAQLLTYAGRARVEIELIDLNELVATSSTLVERWIGTRASLEVELTRPLPRVKADATQLRQVLMNLVINAAESFEGEGGSIRIATGMTRPTGEHAAMLLGADGLSDNDCVFLEVSDDGMGMNEETRARLYEPLFTTKASGRGLGLSATLGIVRAHGGAIQLDSAPGTGSTFRVLLPVPV